MHMVQGQGTRQQGLSRTTSGLHAEKETEKEGPSATGEVQQEVWETVHDGRRQVLQQEDSDSTRRKEATHEKTQVEDWPDLFQGHALQDSSRKGDWILQQSCGHLAVGR